MGHTPHELAEDFPDRVDQIHDLSQSDAHFKRMADEYHEVNRAIHRAETNVEPLDRFQEESLRKQRVQLKDRIYAALTAARTQPSQTTRTR